MRHFLLLDRNFSGTISGTSIYIAKKGSCYDPPLKQTQVSETRPEVTHTCPDITHQKLSKLVIGKCRKVTTVHHRCLVNISFEGEKKQEKNLVNSNLVFFTWTDLLYIMVDLAHADSFTSVRVTYVATSDYVLTV